MDDFFERLQAALIDRYSIEKELGRGGTAFVYLARDQKHGRKVALKVLQPELAASLGSTSFLNEIQITAGLQHPLILPLHDSGAADGILYYVMPYVEGESVRDRLQREGQLPVEDAIRIARDVAEALAYAHEKSVVHRDIKPENILLTGGHAVVADFGIARAIQLAGRTLVQTELVSGTPSYMSPEQATGSQVDSRTDIYSLGCVLYEMLAGSRPFEEPTVQGLLRRILSEPPPPLRGHRPSVSVALEQVVARALEKLPADRYTSAVQFSAALEAVAADTARTRTAELLPPVLPEAGVRLGGWVRLLAAFSAISVALLWVTYFLVRALGLPGWVFPAAVALLLIGLPILALTSLLEAGRASKSPGGGGVAQVPILGAAARWFTWKNAVRGGVLAFLALTLVIAAYTVSRKTGIGPGASLLSAGVLSERDPILIADFENSTPDSLLSDTVKEALQVDLSQSAKVEVVPSSRIGEALARMERPANTPLDPDLARELALREGIKAIITGHVHAAGKGYVLSAELLSTEDGQVLAAYREGADDAGGLIRAIDRLSSKVRERIGESLKTIRANKPLDQVTTHSLEALQKYSQAVRATEFEGNDDKAIQLLTEAVALDTTFAMAYRKLGIVLSNRFREPARTHEAMTRAFVHRERLPDREKYLTEGSYYRLINEKEKAVLAYQSLLDQHPEDAWALNNLAILYHELGDPARGLEFHRRSFEAEPSPLALGNIASALGALGRFEEAEEAVKELEARFPESPGGAWVRIFLAGARADYDLTATLIQERLEATKESSYDQALLKALLGATAAVKGRLREADGLWKEGMEILERAGMVGNHYYPALARATLALSVGKDPRRAISLVEEVLAKHPLHDVPASERPFLNLAEVHAMAGDVNRARTLLSQMEAEVEPLILKSMRSEVHGAIGVIALAENRPEDAVREFQIHRAGFPGEPLVRLPLLARAYELAGEPDSALAAYERFIITPAEARIFEDAFFRAAVLARLGEIYEERGDRDRAIRYYTQFVDLWRNADPELQDRVLATRKKLELLSGVKS